MQRDVRLDLLRVIAVMAVIWLHVSGEVVTVSPDPGDGEWWVGNVADALSRWCVPLFVMASGALLLPQHPDRDPREFYRRRAARLLVPTLVWTLIYLAVRRFDDGSSARTLLVSLVRGAPYYHLWFLYMIVGLYAAAPLLARFREAAPPGFMLGAIGGVFAVSSAESMVAGLAGAERAYTMLGIWPAYLGYFLAGDYLWNRAHLRVSRALALALAIAAGLSTALMAGALYGRLGAKAWEIAYANLQPLVVVMSLALFVLARKTNVTERWAQIMTAAVPLVLGVYLIHPLWLEALKALGIDAFLIHPALGIPVTTALTFALSLVSARALAAIPVLRKAV